MEIKGCKDLLDPSLFDKIAHGDSASSSSAYNHLENMLYSIGDMFAEKVREYVEAFLKQLDGSTLFAPGEWDLCLMDFVHPNDYGFHRMAQGILPLLERMLS